MKYAMITGRITKDAELVTRNVNGTPTPVCNFNVAVNTPTSQKDERGYTIQKTDFYRVTLWRKFAEAMAPSLLKGRKIAVSGKDFALETWMDRQNTQHPTLHFTNPDIEFQDAKPQAAKADEPATDATDGAVPEEESDLPFELNR